ncbi:hypothetical protein QTJ16_004416 [Diplocarpon rosae]|uniref:Uncharacterized protein n=1 Tax=Diplocarpon rosae TaxID=946125 RepID=A0AAD9T048_9HELO|nr:hypothetical protein QTJ16_004416 [Diplocarpon rosae]
MMKIALSGVNNTWKQYIFQEDGEVFNREIVLPNGAQTPHMVDTKDLFRLYVMQSKGRIK